MSGHGFTRARSTGRTSSDIAAVLLAMSIVGTIVLIATAGLS